MSILSENVRIFSSVSSNWWWTAVSTLVSTTTPRESRNFRGGRGHPATSPSGRTRSRKSSTGDSVLVFTTIKESAEFTLQVDKIVEDEDDCEEEDKPAGADDPCLDICGPSGYFRKLTDYLEELARLSRTR